MMTDLHKRVLSAVAGGVFIGWLLTAFIFYPPHPGWGMKEHWGDVATWCSAFATVFAASIALWIALRDARRINRDFVARGRLAMASLYSPLSGISELAALMAKDAKIAMTANDLNSIVQASKNIESIKAGRRLMKPLLATFVPAEAIFLPNDYGTAIAVAFRDAEQFIALVDSAIYAYEHAQKNGNFLEMFKAIQSLDKAPALVRSIHLKVDSFLDACKAELGEIPLEEFLIDDEGPELDRGSVVPRDGIA